MVERRRAHVAILGKVLVNSNAEGWTSMAPDSVPEPNRPTPGLVQALARIAARRLRDDLIEHDMGGVRPIHAPLLVPLLGGGRRAADLADQTGVSRQAVAQVLSTLERDGYVERVADPGDSRAKLVCLTAQGRAALRRIRVSSRALEEEWQRRIGADRLATLREILSELLADVP
jgi:DNA-binding MarR family transcriptional regulator